MREAVLKAAEKYLRFIRASGRDNVGGPCPFHKGGQERKPSFYINLENGMFFCHTCHVKGTFAQFLKAMGESRFIIDAVIDEARKSYKKARVIGAGDVASGQHFLSESLLGVFQYCPVSLVEAGFDEKLLQKLEIGFDRKQHRIIFPLRDLYGNLVGLNGRTVRDEYPRYKVYGTPDLLNYAPDDAQVIARYHRYTIKSHDYWWNLHNVFPSVFYGTTGTIIIVEGYKACIWLLQHGFENTIAIQGSWMSQAQERILSLMGGTVILFLDANEAGRRGSLDAGRRLIKLRYNVKVCSYPEELAEDGQPDNLTPEGLNRVIDSAESFPRWSSQPCQRRLKEGSPSVRGSNKSLPKWRESD